MSHALRPGPSSQPSRHRCPLGLLPTQLRPADFLHATASIILCLPQFFSAKELLKSEKNPESIPVHAAELTGLALH